MDGCLEDLAFVRIPVHMDEAYFVKSLYSFELYDHWLRLNSSLEYEFFV